MTSKEFILWLKGFSEGVNEYNITPKQWDIVKDKLAEVKDEPTPSLPFGVPNIAPIQTLPFIQPYDPYNPYKITSGTTGESGVILTTSSGSNGTITYNPSTTTQWNPSGSNWSYTNNTYRPSADMWNEHQARMAYYTPYEPPYLTDTKETVIKKEE
jgi:hypothetical protein